MEDMLAISGIERNRKHVFDFENGLRMIASRERWNEIVVLHWSFSCPKHWTATEFLKGVAAAAEIFSPEGALGRSTMYNRVLHLWFEGGAESKSLSV